MAYEAALCALTKLQNFAYFIFPLFALNSSKNLSKFSLHFDIFKINFRLPTHHQQTMLLAEKLITVLQFRKTCHVHLVQ